MNKLFERWKLLIGGLDHIIKEEGKKNTKAAKKTVRKGEELVKFLKDKNALITMRFNHDVQDRFSIDSKVYQKKISSVIGQVDREWTLVTHLEYFKTNIEGSLKSFLQRAIHKPCCFLVKSLVK